MDWKEEARIGQLKKSIRAKYTLLGRRARVKGYGAEGSIVVSSFQGEAPEYFLKYDDGDLEQVCCLDVYLQDESGHWEQIPNGVQMFPELTAEELELTGLNDHDTVLEKI